MRERTTTISKTSISILCAVLAGGCIGDELDELDEGDDLGELEQAVCNNDCEDDPEGNPSSPPSPTIAVVTDRDRIWLEVEYKTQMSWTAVQLQRRAPGGAWSAVSSAGAGVTSTRTVVDGNKTPDSRTCYRVKATNSLGTRYSSETCGLTLPPAGAANPRLNRLQLLVKVSSLADAGTESRVSARLNRMLQPPSHYSALNPAPRLEGGSWIDSFTTGRTFTYELEQDGLRNLRDVSEISIYNWGDDALCIERVELLANRAVAFTKDFGVATCRWIETQSGSAHPPELVIPFEELRAAPSFTGFVSPTFSGPVTRVELEERIESLVGNLIAHEPAKWGRFSGPRAVEMWRVDPTTVHVDLDLEGVMDDFFNLEIDLDFDMRVGLVQGSSGIDLTFDVLNVVSSADYHWWAEVLGALGGAGGYTGLSLIENYVENRIEESFTGDRFALPLGPSECPVAPTVTVDENTQLRFCCLNVCSPQ